MAWYFVDRQGREGWVGEDLSVDYSGEEGIVELVETFADEVEDESVRDPIQTVMIELYTTGAVRAIERYNAETIRTVGPSRAVDRSAHADGERFT